MARKIVLLFDGTWNNKKSRTNVTRMRESIVSTGQDDADQPCFYDEGVGTHWYDRLTGGAFGRGLSLNIRQGYRWLCGKHREGDEIFVFGFSRGAYTARSLVGMIRKCGVLTTASDELVRQAYDFYRDKSVSPRDRRAAAFRQCFSRETRVKFIGVWDTVGALGIPASRVPFSRDYYRWHDTELSKIVDYAYHAIAVDERRRDYDVAAWTNDPKPENVEVEQRWFVGAHANVGGGFGVDSLSNPPLRWIQEKARARGLALHSLTDVDGEDRLAPIEDSYGKFMFGIYQFFRPRFNRPYGMGINETMDESVRRRWERDPAYRPASVATQMIPSL